MMVGLTQSKANLGLQGKFKIEIIPEPVGATICGLSWRELQTLNPKPHANSLCAKQLVLPQSHQLICHMQLPNVRRRCSATAADWVAHMILKRIESELRKLK